MNNLENFDDNYNNYKSDFDFLSNTNPNDYISTKKKRTKYSFITSDKSTKEKEKDKFQENFSTKHEYTYFYQLCDFKNPNNNFYHLRKFTVNRKNEFESIKNYYLIKSQYKKFLKTNRPHTYKRFNRTSLDRVDPPSYFDINTSKSDILATDSNYTGYAPFE
jgi:hypothetical protein